MYAPIYSFTAEYVRISAEETAMDVPPSTQVAQEMTGMLAYIWLYVDPGVSFVKDKVAVLGPILSLA